jgi:cellulose synthase/poly-beta-1,6-N-acetylglucosamine synthase-like glycosyltransferase
MTINWRELLFIVFCADALVQLYYYLNFFRRVAYPKVEERLMSREHPVSVIICARDEAANLAKFLPGTLLQQYKTSYEVVVVNDNSQDETRYLLEGMHKEFRQLNVVELKQEAMLIPGKKYPLSVGIKTAKHEILLMTDADCVPATEHWIQKMQEAFTDGKEIALGYGAYQKKKTLLNALIRFDTFHTALQYFSYALAGLPYMGVGRNLAYRKDLFFRHKGFSSHNHIPSGDDDLFINLAARKDNTTVVMDKEAFTLSEPKKSWRAWIKQKNRHFSTGKFYRPIHRFLLGLYALTNFLFWPLFITSIIFFDWRWALVVFLPRLILQGLYWKKAMDRLDESDLWPWFPLLDAWMFFYYLIFAPALWKRPKASWK